MATTTFKYLGLILIDKLLNNLYNQGVKSFNFAILNILFNLGLNLFMSYSSTTNILNHMFKTRIKPIDVVVLLNNLYTLFDFLVDQNAVFKVSTRLKN